MAAMGPSESSDISDSKKHVEAAKRELEASDSLQMVDTHEVQVGQAQALKAIGHLLAAIITGDEDE